MSADDLDVVREVVERGVEAVHARGHRWLFDTLVAALDRLSPSCTPGSDAAESCALAWTVVGDLHDIHDAPLSASRCYLQATRLDPGLGQAWMELGVCQSETGEFEAARSSLRRALACDPGDVRAREELRILSDPEEMPTPCYSLGDPLWRAAELIAQDLPREALEVLGPARADEVRICAAAIQGDCASVLELLGRLDQGVHLGYPFWFCVPEPLFGDPSFWKALVDLGVAETSFVPRGHPRFPRPDAEGSPRERVAAQVALP